MKFSKFSKSLKAIENGERIPRKTKKWMLGKKVSNRKLREMIANVEIVENEYPQPATILPFEFCPNCGCDLSWSTGNMVGYPEVWEEDYCARCGKYVGGADNCVCSHVLEYIGRP